MYAAFVSSPATSITQQRHARSDRCVPRYVVQQYVTSPVLWRHGGYDIRHAASCSTFATTAAAAAAATTTASTNSPTITTSSSSSTHTANGDEDGGVERSLRGHKFHLRVYVVIMADLRAYIYRRAFAHVANKPYRYRRSARQGVSQGDTSSTSTSTSDTEEHITNVSVRCPPTDAVHIG